MVGRNRHDGLTIIEVMIVVLIMLILIVIVLPRFSDASQSARAENLRQDLQFIRRQLRIYESQHQGRSAGYPVASGKTPADSTPSQAILLAQLTSPSSPDGRVGPQHDADHSLGPYMSEMPVNPMNNKSAVWVIPDIMPMPPRPARNGMYGWVYRPYTNEFRAYLAGQDENGGFYFQY